MMYTLVCVIDWQKLGSWKLQSCKANMTLGRSVGRLHCEVCTNLCITIVQRYSVLLHNGLIDDEWPEYGALPSNLHNLVVVFEPTGGSLFQKLKNNNSK